jgi:hypothetical protein
VKKDYAYVRSRAAAERAGAAKAANPPARQAHLELAEQYEQLAAQIEAQITSDKVGGFEVDLGMSRRA